MYYEVTITQHTLIYLGTKSYGKDVLGQLLSGDVTALKAEEGVCIQHTFTSICNIIQEMIKAKEFMSKDEA